MNDLDWPWMAILCKFLAIWILCRYSNAFLRQFVKPEWRRCICIHRGPRVVSERPNTERHHMLQYYKRSKERERYFNIRTYIQYVVCKDQPVRAHEILLLAVNTRVGHRDTDLMTEWKRPEVVPNRLRSASWRSMSGSLQMLLEHGQWLWSLEGTTTNSLNITFNFYIYCIAVFLLVSYFPVSQCLVEFWQLF